MPNIWTPYPEIVKDILKESGFKCGIETKKILVDCPTERFCAFSGERLYGELCVNPLEELGISNFNLPIIFILIIVIAVLSILLFKYYRGSKHF